MKLLLTFFVLLCSISHVKSEYHKKNEPSSENLFSENNNLVKDAFGIRTKRGSSPIETENGIQNSFQCAVMYRNNVPVGILQPYQDSYRVLPVDKQPALVDINLLPEKRSITDRSVEEDGHKENKGHMDNKYPSVFTKFRINSKLDRPTEPKSIVKRSLAEEDEADKNNYNAVEEELGHILDDMSLVDDYPNLNVERKGEDEDLELGSNRINLLKEDHTKTRQTRDEIDNSPQTNGDSGDILLEVPKLDPGKLDNSLLIGDSDQQEDKSAACVSLAPSSQEYLTTVQEPIEKRSQDYEKEDTSILECDAKYSDEDMGMDEESKRVERGIRDKIRKLKEQVWKEVSKLKKTKPKKTGHVAEDTQRKKRQIVNTLLDEENSEIDPNFNEDEDESVHIRRKREI